MSLLSWLSKFKKTPLEAESESSLSVGCDAPSTSKRPPTDTCSVLQSVEPEDATRQANDCSSAANSDKRGLVLHGNKDDAFAKSGYSHWKKALERFDKHENSASHHEAVDLLVTIPNSTSDVGEMLSSALAEEKAENRKMLSTIISTIRYLGRQGLPLRGHYKSGGISDEKGEIDSNFLQLLKVRAEDDEGLKKWLTKSQCKYTSPDVQNEILRIMALSILRDISSELAGKWFTIMIDETTDVSNAEQMVICLRYVDANLEVHEQFIGLYNLERTNAEMIVSVVEDVLLRMNLSITNCRGQCYDGASNMSGI
eukprot:Em0021g382a